MHLVCNNFARISTENNRPTFEEAVQSAVVHLLSKHIALKGHESAFLCWLRCLFGNETRTRISRLTWCRIYVRKCMLYSLKNIVHIRNVYDTWIVLRLSSRTVEFSVNKVNFRHLFQAYSFDFVKSRNIPSWLFAIQNERFRIVISNETSIASIEPNISRRNSCIFFQWDSHAVILAKFKHCLLNAVTLWEAPRG